MMNQYSSLGVRFPLIILVIVVIWTLFWKGFAVWTAAKKGQRIWFLALLIFNTVGILEIIYLFAVAGKKWSDIKRVFLEIVLFKKIIAEKKQNSTTPENK